MHHMGGGLRRGALAASPFKAKARRATHRRGGADARRRILCAAEGALRRGIHGGDALRHEPPSRPEKRGDP
eukprot:CAMPEP_0176258470 /NCGR_PEP_ID=MMETSP0121_2-20121125/38574_1 /TAXON_ID=160619 /ORGANISM="Kryptoperidinium foliaceum, Strain CCMP 1326" /LENGTH=70 /DNA_ID=CAMNT_0017598331 /DNA_START=93 /DNA_END=302 /DNA_ORIENTATION=-